jgi:hypothetical protein
MVASNALLQWELDVSMLEVQDWFGFEIAASSLGATRCFWPARRTTLSMCARSVSSKCLPSTNE